VTSSVSSCSSLCTAGTFLYVFMEELHDEFKENADKGNAWLKFGCVMFGFALMAVVAVWT
jgi:zinc transporter ZupT